MTSWACSSFRADEISRTSFGCQSCQWKGEISLLGMRVSLSFVAENACPWDCSKLCNMGPSSGDRDKPRLHFLASTPAPSPIFIVILESGHSSFYWIVSDVGTNYSPYIKFSTNTEMPPRLPYGGKPSTPFFLSSESYKPGSQVLALSSPQGTLEDARSLL